jgi:hypothetical protein
MRTMPQAKSRRVDAPSELNGFVRPQSAGGHRSTGSRGQAEAVELSELPGWKMSNSASAQTSTRPISLTKWCVPEVPGSVPGGRG